MSAPVVPLLALLAGLVLVGCGTADAEELPPQGRIAALVRGDRYPRMMIEVDAVAGMEPDAAAREDVAAELGTVLDKPDGIDLVLDETLAPFGVDHAWTGDELSALRQKMFNRPVDDDTVAVHVLALDGYSAGDTDEHVTVGLSWDSTYIVLFSQSIHEACSGRFVPLPSQEALCGLSEYAILLHEMGHLLGLVNLGTSMVDDHEDTDHPAHCENPDCVMYWLYERRRSLDDLAERFVGGDTRGVGFDDACRDDIARFRDGL
jgi:hypothetical protein